MLDSGNSAVLVLLNLTTAFDTTNHSIILSRHEECVLIKGTAIKWFQLYLTDIRFSVQLGEFSSSTCVLNDLLLTVDSGNSDVLVTV